MHYAIRFNFYSLIIIGLLAGSSLFAQDDQTDSEKPKSIAEQLSAIKTAHREMVTDLTAAYRDADGEETKLEIVEQRRKAELEISLKAIELTQKNDDRNQNIEVLGWLTRYSKGKGREVAAKHLLKKYLDAEEIESWLLHLDRFNMPTQLTEDSLRLLMQNSPHRVVRGKAALTLARYFLRIVNTTSDARSRLSERVGPYLEKWTSEKSEAEMERLMTICAEQYADVEFDRRSTVGQLAEIALAQLQLKIGKIAPDIEGEDIDGVEFKLSDYRGKVVVIDFWGDW